MEIKSDEGPMGKEALKKAFDVRNLTLVEHLFIGSSENVDGELWGQSKIEEYLRQEKNVVNLRKKLLAPIALLEGQKTKEEISPERVQKKRLTGLFTVFDIDQQLCLTKQDTICIELGDLGENGQISGEWKVGLADGKGKEIDFPEELKLAPSFSKYFTLEKDPRNPNGKGRILKLNVNSAENASSAEAIDKL